MNFQYNFRTLSRLIWALVLISTLILFISRLTFFINIVDWSQLGGRWEDLYRAFFTGMRFDLKIVAIGFSPLLISGLACACYDNWFKAFRKISHYYSLFITFLLISFSIGNYYYYATYGTYFDLFVFGLVDDDTNAVLINVWQDFPVISALIASIVGTWFANAVYRKLLTKSTTWQWPQRHWVKSTALVLITIMVYFVLARGSTGTFPLRRLHANVSDYVVLNMVTPNPFMALSWANSDYKKQAVYDPITELEYTQKMTELLGQATPFYKTPYNAYLAENKPHVVIGLMEGMGTNVWIEDVPEINDLMGELRKPFEDDFVFKRFVAETSGTINSLVAMLFNSHSGTLSHSNVQNVVLPYSAITPYKEQGYEVTFIMSSNGMWRNLANYLPLQGFDHFVDENLLKKEFPESRAYSGVWGVPDEFAFKYAQKVLKESNKPQMIYILTATNHPPFEVPGAYKALPVKPSERMIKLSGPLADQNVALLQTYQYANNALGDFINQIKSSNLSDKTVIAATGDHRVRYLDANQPADFAMTHGVPFYLYVPKVILDNVEYVYDDQRIGSHRDIFPTLYQFSLSDTEYVSLGGENMLKPEGVDNFGYHVDRVINTQGAYDTARSDYLYEWKENGFHNKTQAINNPDAMQSIEYKTLQDIYLRWQVQEGR
jgi:phosphoglycerol transferase MdoB-like AlkP superfamily enzyme